MNSEKLIFAVRTMIKTDKMHKCLFEAALSDSEVRRSAHFMLRYIRKNGELSSQKELAKLLDITPAAVTGALKRLEADGYITRSLGKDNRYNVIQLTDVGNALLDSTEEKFRKIDSSMFDGFTEEELDFYISCHEKIQNNIMAMLKGEKCL